VFRTSLFALALVTASTQAHAKPFDAYFAGSGARVGEDSNADGRAASLSEGRAISRRWGSFTISSLNELAPWDGSSFCPVVDGQWNARLSWIEYSEVWTFADLEQVHLALSPTEDSYLCARADGTFYIVLHAVVVGGTGAFAGKTGHVTATAEGRSLANAAGQSAFTGTLTGDIE
jgi:hypothetical protein